MGSSNTDMLIRAPHLPTPGKTVLGADLMVAHGDSPPILLVWPGLGSLSERLS